MKAFLKLNTFLISANVLKTLLQDLSLCNLIAVYARWKNIGSVSESIHSYIQLQKLVHLSFATCLIEIFYA